MFTGFDWRPFVGCRVWLNGIDQYGMINDLRVIDGAPHVLLDDGSQAWPLDDEIEVIDG